MTAPDAGIVTRRATSANRRAALRHEASILRMARHPGVTELIRINDGDGATELTTRSGSSHALSDWDGPDHGPEDVTAIAGVLAALAATCSDLHGIGIVHGRIEPQRVAMLATGQPVLTGFEAAGPIGTIPLPADPTLPPFCDPAAGAKHPLQPTVDVFGLGALLEHLLERHPPGGGDSDRRTRRKLRRLARTATVETPERRPDAAALAAAIVEVVPAAHLPDRSAGSVPSPPSSAAIPRRLPRPSADSGPPRSGGRARRWAIAAGLLVAIGGLFALARGRPAVTSETARDSRPATAAPEPIASSTVRSIVPSTGPSKPSTGSGSQIGTSTTTLPAASTPSAPASEPSYVVFEGIRYRIDGGHRRFAVGDWDCDGSATLATLDPSTGALTFFEAWPQSGSTRATAADHVAGAIDLRAEPNGRCHLLTVVHADGTDTYAPGDPP